MTIVTTYAAIKNQLKEMVSSAIPSAKLAVMDYWGDIDSDLKNIIGEITTIDPIGTFAVSSIVYEQAKAAAYHQVSISIQYKRTEEEIKSIKDVPNDRALREEIAEMVGNFNTYSLLNVATNKNEDDIIKLINKLYYRRSEERRVGKEC